MSTTEPPTTNFRRQKRKNVQASDGWTVVTHSSNSNNAEKSAIEDKQLQDAKPTRTVPGLTVDQLVQDLEKKKIEFRNSDCYKGLEESLKKTKGAVKEALCIGIGSFSLDWEHRWRSMWQLVLFTAIVEILSQGGFVIASYAREPLFTDLDVAFLSHLHITTLSDDASTQSHTGPSTFVFAPFVERQILLPIFLKGKDPVLYIGNEILDDYGLYKKADETEGQLQECNDVGAGFLKGRSMSTLGSFEGHAFALRGLVTYCKELDI